MVEIRRHPSYWHGSRESQVLSDGWQRNRPTKRVQFKKIFQLKNDFQVYNLILIETDSWIRDGVD